MKVLYKTVNAAAVLALIPVLLFLPMFRFVMVVGMNSSNQLMSLLGGLINVEEIIGKVTGIDIQNLPESYTLKEAYGMFAGDNPKLSLEGFDASVIPADVVKYFSAAGILFALALLLALAVAVLGLFLKKKKATTAISALSFVSAFAAGKCFNHIAAQMVSGKISLVNILTGIPAFAEYKNYISFIDIDIRLFKLSSAFSLTLVVLAAIFMINVCFLVLDSVNEKN